MILHWRKHLELLYSNKYFLLISTESSHTKISSYLHAKCHNFRKSTEIGLDNIALLSFGKFKKVKADIARLKQTTEFVEIPPEKSII